MNENKITVNEKLDPKGKNVIKSYIIRWYILFVFALNALMQSVQVLLYQSIPEAVFEYYKEANIDVSSLNLFFSVVAIMFCVFIPVMIWIDALTDSIRVLTVTSTLFLLIQNIIRMLPHWIPSWLKYAKTIIVISHVFNGMGGGLCYALSTRVGSVWFPANERTVAAAIGSQVSPLGMALSFFIFPLLTTKADEVVNSLYFMLIFQAVLSFIIVIYFPAKPKIPPSYSELAKEKEKEEEARKILEELNNKDMKEKEGNGDVAVVEVKGVEEIDRNNEEREEKEEEKDENEDIKKLRYNNSQPEDYVTKENVSIQDVSASNYNNDNNNNENDNENDIDKVDDRVKDNTCYSSCCFSSKSLWSKVPMSIRLRRSLVPVITFFRFFTDIPILLLCFLTLLQQGVFQTWESNLLVLFISIGIEDKKGDYVTFAHFIMTVIGTLVESSLSDRCLKRKDKIVLVIVLILNFIFSFFFIFTFPIYDPNNEGDVVTEDGETYRVLLKLPFPLLAVLICIHGFFIGCLIPLFYNMSAEIAYPVADSVSGGIITFFCSIGTSSFPLLFGWLGIEWMNVITASSLFVGVIVSMFLKINYKRSDIEERKQKEEKERKEKEKEKEDNKDDKENDKENENKEENEK